MTPWLMGIVPLGFVIGISAARADMPIFAGWLTGPLIFSGSAQAATIQLLDAHAAPLVAILGGLALNLRLVLYSATMARHWHSRPRWSKAFAAYTLVDPSVSVAAEGYDRGDAEYGHLHYVGGAATLWVGWLAAITLGATFGAVLPPGLRLEFVIPLYLLGQVVPRVSDAAATRAVAIAIVLAAAATGVPMHLSVLIAIAGGTLGALASGERSR